MNFFCCVSQSLAIPAIVGGGDYLLAAQTGSGKTLAYLLPIIHMLKAREGEPGMERRGKRPKAVVLAPTKELVEQVGLLRCSAQQQQQQRRSNEAVDTIICSIALVT
jgi:Rad3-related DNA helicase